MSASRESTFLQLRRKYLIAAACISVAAGTIFALLAAGATLIGLKLSLTRFSYAWAIAPAAIGIALVVGGGVFLLIYRSKRRFAKYLDNKYALSERTLTALEYEDSSDEFSSLQRADAEEHLKAIPKFKPKPAYLIVAAIAILAAIAIFVSGVAIGWKKAPSAPPPPPAISDDEPYELSEFQRLALLAIIENLNSVSLNESATSSLKTILSNLLASLEEITLKADMVEAVSAAIDEMSALLIDGVSALPIYASLTQEGQNGLARALHNGLYSFRSLDVTAFENLATFEENELQYTLNAYSASLSRVFEEDPAILSVAITVALTAYGESDGVTSALSALSAGLLEQNDMEALLATFSQELQRPLALQAYRMAVRAYLIVNIKNIFDIPLDGSEGNSGSGGDSSNPDDSNQSGGFGKGDVIYGSDDLVFDPNTGKYVKYGELINYYYAIVQETLRGDTLSIEQQQAVREYFDMLFGGIENAE